ncbi:hypothetical protein HHK36_020753 [Tetracentron sinense]|uniref:Uncharacterized protein n=1 Tax=Tetracentron sinense TaxID=13715 RepID=A0A834YUJ7_TETSI|nr:hypothetical protein HHK36_020753 [Tetracentron sinense]
MEAMVRKYQQKLRKVRDEMDRWNELQSRLLRQFRNASLIIERLPVLQESKNYHRLACISGIREDVVVNQMESLETILFSMKMTIQEFHGVVLSLEKILRDGRQLVKGGSMVPTVEQMELKVGIKPSLADCLERLTVLHEMHHSEYLLKSSVVAVVPTLVFKPSGGDLGALHQLLVDQPNIPREEVEFIFGVIFAED